MVGSACSPRSLSAARSAPLKGTLIARLRIPSFIVTLAGFLLFSGILIVLLGGADCSVNLNTSDPNQNIIYEMVQGLILPSSAWVVLAVVVGAYGATHVAARGKRGGARA